MKRIMLCIVVLATFVAGLAFAAGARGTPEQAKALAEEALKFYEVNGKDKALAEFSNKTGKFVKGDLYIFVLDFTGMTLAHGANAKLIGQSIYDLKDADGKTFVHDMVDIAKTKGTGWVDYKWGNPETKKIEPKTSYIIRIKGTDSFVGCGAYK